MGKLGDLLLDGLDALLGPKRIVVGVCIAAIVFLSVMNLSSELFQDFLSQADKELHIALPHIAQ